MNKVRIAGAQYRVRRGRDANVAKASELVRVAAAGGAQIVCLPELGLSVYFCTDEDDRYFDWAEPIPGPATEELGAVARATGTVVLVPVFERADDGFYNTCAVVGPRGELIGKYRKSSIPFMDRSLSSEPRGNEKYFFKPGNLGFPVFDTPFGTKIGILICYDRHFPEAARVLGLGGADVLFVPTATSGMTKYLWDLELKAHAVANLYYVCGVNRVGVDEGGSTRNHFGSSLIVDPKANVLAQASDDRDEVVCADVDPAFIAETRRLWGFYRDRRPDLYGPVVGQLTGAGR